MEIPKELQTEIWDYCRVNNITNVDEFTLKVFKQGFTAAKFGSTPMGLGGDTEIKEVEKIVEKVVEKVVIKEVEVEKIVEVVVEKEVFISDDEAVNKLQKRIDELTLELEQTKKDYLDDVNSQEVRIKLDAKNYTELHDEHERLKKELEEEKKKPKKEENKDIYTEGKGTFGSNISDILWPKKKQ